MRKTSVDLEERQYNLAESMANNGDAASQSEAIRDAIEYYAQEMGYTNGEKRDTQLRWWLQRLAAALVYIGLGTVGVVYFLPIKFRMAAVAPIVVGLGVYAIDRVLAEYEPAVSKRLNQAFNTGDRV